MLVCLSFMQGTCSEGTFRDTLGAAGTLPAQPGAHLLLMPSS